MQTKILINLPNDYFSTEVNAQSLSEFEVASEYGNVVFGWVDKGKSLYVFMSRDEYEKLLEWKEINLVK